MQEFLEKRGFPRMITDCTARYALENQPLNSEGIVKDLSGNGLMLWVKEPISVNQKLNVKITPLNPVTPPLEALVVVTRCDDVDLDGEAFQYALACSVEKFEDAQIEDEAAV